MGRLRRLNKSAALIVVCVALIGAGAWLGMRLLTEDDGLDCASWRFDPAEWRQARDRVSESALSTRRQAAEELGQCQPFRGIDSARVRRLFGRPSNRSPEVGGPNEFWFYYLGPSTEGLRLGDDTLTLELDGRGRLVRFSVAAD